MNQLENTKCVRSYAYGVSNHSSDTRFKDVLNELVDESFICIGNDEDEFVGIVTRKELGHLTSWYMNSPMNKTVEKSNRNKLFRVL